MLARCKELIPLVAGGDVRSVHDGVFFHQAQPAAAAGGIEDGVGGQRLPRDVEGAVAIHEVPDMTSRTGVDPFGTVFEAGLVVAVPHFEGVGSEADVGGDRTVDRAPPAVVVAVLGQLALEHLVLTE